MTPRLFDGMAGTNREHTIRCTLQSMPAAAHPGFKSTGDPRYAMGYYHLRKVGHTALGIGLLRETLTCSSLRSQVHAPVLPPVQPSSPPSSPVSAA
jgi:hypothetical protein